MTRPSRGRMILSPTSPVSKLDRRRTGRLRKRDNLQTEEGEGVGEEPNNSIAGKPRRL
jgi:hypothetical protein